jgi:hypothetical protein
MKMRTRWLLAAAIYFAYIIIVLMPIWSTAVEPKWDGRDFNYPKFAYAIETIRSGHLPLWDPYTNCGQPFISDPQLAWYQPAAVIAGLIRQSPLEGYALFWTATWIWAGLGAFFLAAVLGAGPSGSIVSAMSFSLSGFFIGHGQHLPYEVTAAWMPWVFALAHRAVQRESYGHVLLAGVALGLSALGGYAGLVIFELLGLALWLALAFLVPWSGQTQKPDVAFRRRLLWVIGVSGITTTLLAVVWSPALYALLVEARNYTDRAQPLDPQIFLSGNPFSLKAALTFLFPRLVIDQTGFFPADISMNNAYIGALSLPLALIGLASLGRRAFWILAFAIFWFWVSLGSDGGLRTLLHYLAPPTDYMRHNAMLSVLFLMPLTALAGLGATLVFSDSHVLIKLRNFTAGWLVILIGASVVLATVFGADHNLFQAVIHPIAICAAGLVIFSLVFPKNYLWVLPAALTLLFGLDLTWHLRSNSFTVWMETPQSQSIKEIEGWGKNSNPIMYRDTSSVYRITSLNLVNRIPVIEGYVALQSDFNSALVPTRFSSVLARHRFWLSPSAWQAPPPQAGLSELGNLNDQSPIPVFVTQRADQLLGMPAVPGSFGKVQILSYKPEQVKLDVQVPPSGDAILASTERYAPSWRVSVDGTAKPVIAVNYFFRGVHLKPGQHRVVFDYYPRTFLFLFLTSYATILIATFVAIYLLKAASLKVAPVETEKGLQYPDGC